MDIQQTFSNKIIPLFRSSICFLPKGERKEVQCLIFFRFIEKRSLKNDFRNCRNDFLIASTAANRNLPLISKDKLLNKFVASELGKKIPPGYSDDILISKNDNMSNENKILQAVIESLKTYKVVKIGDWVVPGKVRSFLKGYPISDENLKEELSEYIDQGYFEVIKRKNKNNAVRY